eukprot:1606602-Prymnesium_polylepis.1
MRTSASSGTARWSRPLSSCSRSAAHITSRRRALSLGFWFEAGDGVSLCGRRGRVPDARRARGINQHRNAQDKQCAHSSAAW